MGALDPVPPQTWKLPHSFSVVRSLSNVYLFGCIGLSCSMWRLAPWPGIKPKRPALGARRLSHRTTKEVPLLFSVCHFSTSSSLPEPPPFSISLREAQDLRKQKLVDSTSLHSPFTGTDAPEAGALVSGHRPESGARESELCDHLPPAPNLAEFAFTAPEAEKWS